MPIICFSALTFFYFYTINYYGKNVYTPETVLKKKVALVFGAGVLANQLPSRALLRRIETGVDLYKKGKVDILLMSGDNRFAEYNEPKVMKKVAMQLGVPESSILLDFAGRRTYDTCYRAKHVFNVHEAILVSQPFHLPRAAFLCAAKGIEAVSVGTDDGGQYSLLTVLGWYAREALAIIVAWWDVYIHPPQTLL